MKALILAADGVEDLEFYYPYFRLKEESIEIDIAGLKLGKVEGKHGYTIEIEKKVEKTNPANYDLLILPGGKAPESLRLNDNVLSLAEKMFSDKKPVAAICHGTQILISAKLLNGKKATCWPGVKDDIIAAGAQYSDEEVVVDDNLITSRNPFDLPAFMREVLKKVK